MNVACDQKVICTKKGNTCEECLGPPRSIGPYLFLCKLLSLDMFPVARSLPAQCEFFLSLDEVVPEFGLAVALVGVYIVFPESPGFHHPWDFFLARRASSHGCHQPV